MDSHYELITSLTKFTVEELKNLSQKIGLSNEEHDQNITELNSKVENVFETLLEQWQNEKTDLQERIEECHQQIKQIVEQLCDNDESLQYLEQLDCNLPFRRRVFEIEDLLARLQKKRDLRYNVLGGFLSKIKSLCNEMNLTISDNFNEIGNELSSERIIEFEGEHKRLEEEKKIRIQKVAYLVASISNLWKELEILPEHCTSELDQAILSMEHTHVGISDQSIQKLEERYQELKNEKINRMKNIDKYSKQILPLWEKLGVSQEEKKAFSKTVQGLSINIVKNYETELKRLNTLKISKLDILIQTTKAQIEELWKQLRFSDEQRTQSCPAYTHQQPSILVLNELEEYLSTLKIRLDSTSSVMILVNKRENLINEVKEYRDNPPDSKTFYGRDGFKVRAYEDKIRKYENKTIVKLEASILEAVTQWEKENNDIFTIDGVSYRETIQKYREVKNASAMVKSKVSSTPKLNKSSRKKSDNLKVRPQSSKVNRKIGKPPRPPTAPQTTNLKKTRPRGRSVIDNKQSAGLNTSKTTPNSATRNRAYSDRSPLVPRNLSSEMNSMTPISSSKTQTLLQSDSTIKIKNKSEQYISLVDSIQTAAANKQFQIGVNLITEALGAIEEKNWSQEEVIDLYHRRSVLFTRLQDYDKALEDSSK